MPRKRCKLGLVEQPLWTAAKDLARDVDVGETSRAMDPIGLTTKSGPAAFREPDLAVLTCLLVVADRHNLLLTIRDLRPAPPTTCPN